MNSELGPLHAEVARTFGGVSGHRRRTGLEPHQCATGSRILAGRTGTRTRNQISVCYQISGRTLSETNGNKCRNYHKLYRMQWNVKNERTYRLNYEL